MKKQLIALAIGACLTNIASAETTGFYLGTQLGGSLANTEAVLKSERDFKLSLSSEKSVFAAGIMVGYNFNTKFGIPIRTELNYTTRKDSIVSGVLSTNDVSVPLKVKTDVDTAMFNVYYDIYTNSNFTPYFTLGAGAAFIDYASVVNHTAFTSSSKTNFAYSLGLGVSYKITDRWSADIMARSIFAGKVDDKTKHSEEIKLRNHDLMVGILYNF